MKRVLLTASLFMFVFSNGVSAAADNGKPTALIIGGEGGYATLTDQEMATVFHGYFADYNRINVPFPGDGNDFAGSIAAGADALYAKVYATDGKKTIAGASEGGPAVYEVLRRLANDPNRPSKDELDAIVYAAPGPLFYTFGPLYQPPPATQYDLTIIKAEYDGITDAPDNLLNLLAVANAYYGAKQLHVDAAFTTDLSTVPAQDFTTVDNTMGGSTTTVIVPTPVLPLLQPLIDKGASPAEIAVLDRMLRPIIDSAYIRTWTGHQVVQASPPAPPQQPTSAPAATVTLSAASPAAAVPTGAVRKPATTPTIRLRANPGLSTPPSASSSQEKGRHRATGSTLNKSGNDNAKAKKGAARARR